MRNSIDVDIGSGWKVAPGNGMHSFVASVETLGVEPRIDGIRTGNSDRGAVAFVLPAPAERAGSMAGG